MKMQIDFSDKRVLVTGGTDAIGRGTVEGFLAHGARVAVHGPDAESVSSTIAALGGDARLVAVPGNLTTASGCKHVVEQAVAALGGLDVLVNAAAQRDDKAFEEVSPDSWANTLNGTFKAALFCTQQAAPSLKASGGNVVNIASIVGVMGGPSGTTAASAAAGSIINLTRMSALRLGVDGIRVNCLCPGVITDPEATQGAVAEAPTVGRPGTVDDMTGTILFLSSPYAGFMTGSIIVNDGGKTAGT